MSHKRKWLKHIALLVAVLLSINALLSCRPAPAATPTPPPKVIKVGVLSPLTGVIAAYGQDQVNGVNMAVEEINAAGGLLGHKLVVQVEDDEKKPELAASMTQKLINDGVDVIIGGMSSSSTMAGGPIANRAEVIMISPWSTNPLAAEGDWVFRACFSDEFQGAIQAKFMVEELKCKRPAMLLDIGDEGSKGQGTVVQKTLEKLGVPLVAFESYTTGDTDFRAQLTKIKAMNPDCLCTPNYYGEDALIRVQMKELGLDIPTIGGDGNDSPEFFKIAGEAANGFLMTTHYAPDDPRPIVQEFRKKYVAKFGEVPRSTAALSYDAVMLYKIAVEKAGTLDKYKVRETLAGLKDITTLVTAPTFTMDPTGTGIKSLAIVEAKDGDWVFRAVVNP
ncbi:MAG: ABC transporter substrate-binding protein [Anaerolineae bacterium]